MSAFPKSQIDNAKALYKYVNTLVDGAMKFHAENKRKGNPPQKIEVPISKNLVIPPELIDKIKRAGIIIKRV